MTVKIDAHFNNDVADAKLDISAKNAGPATPKTLYAYPEKTSCYINDVVPVRYVVKYSDGSTKDISYSDLSDFSFWFEPDGAPTDDWQVDVHDCYLYSTGFVATDGEAGSLLNLAGKLTGSSYNIECDVSYTENGKTLKTDFYITVNVEIVGVEVAASGKNLYKSKPNQRVSFWPKFQLRTGDGSKAYFGLSSEAQELAQMYGDYGFNLRGSEVHSWELTVDDCLSADLYYKTEIDLFVRYPGLSIVSTNVTYDPNN